MGLFSSGNKASQQQKARREKLRADARKFNKENLAKAEKEIAFHTSRLKKGTIDPAGNRHRIRQAELNRRTALRNLKSL